MLMDDQQREVLNTFFVDTFNKITALEERAIARSSVGKISVKELHILEAVSLLQKKGKNTMTEIAVKVGITVGALTTAVNTLVKKEYLARKRSEADRRVVFITLTEKGLRAEMHHKVFHENMMTDVERVLSPEGLDNLITSLQQLTEFFSNQLSAET